MDNLLKFSVFLILFVTAGIADKHNPPIYGALGQNVILTPGPWKEEITSVMWKHGDNIAISWDQDGMNSYRQYKNIAHLNTSTGALTITNLTRNETGNYTVEVNNMVINTTELQVISPLSKPTVSMSCDTEMTYCLLTCEGNTSDAEPITFMWVADDMVWLSTNVWNISKETLEYWLSCSLKNPVSFASSDVIINPFRSRSRIGIIGALLLIAVCVIIATIVIKCRKAKCADRTPQEETGESYQQVPQTEGSTSQVSIEIPNGTVALPNGHDTHTSAAPASPASPAAPAAPAAPDTRDEPPVKPEVSDEPPNKTAESSESNNGAGNSSVMPNEKEAGGQDPAVDKQEVEE